MRSRLLLIATVSAALLGPAAGASADTCTGVDLMPDATNAPAVADATLCLINEQRAAVGARPLVANDTLSSASAAYAADMVARSFFDHQTPDGVTLDDRLRRVGYSYDIAGENIAWGEGPLSTPASIVDAWMHSEGHRTNILDGDFRQIGLGILPGVPRAGSVFPGATYVTDFGTRFAQPATRSTSSTTSVDDAASSNPLAHYAAKKLRASKHVRKHPRKHVRKHVRRHRRGHARHHVQRYQT